MVCAACCHMVLVFAIMYLPLKINKSGIIKLDRLTIPACPSLMWSCNRGNIEGPNSSKMSMVLFYVGVEIGFVE